MNLAISGSNRGIGLEFSRQLTAHGDRAFAGARKPGKGELQLDVTDAQSVESFARMLDGVPVDLLIHNAGVKGPQGSLERYDFDAALETFDVNAIGALRLTAALLPNLGKSKLARVVGITSGLGSIADNESGGHYAYRMSKAALNIAIRSLAHDYEFIAVVIQPGWVRTDMGGAGAPTAADESVRGMIKVIDSLTKKDSGEFFTWQGEKFPW